MIVGMGRPSAPVADWPFARQWQNLTPWRTGRILAGVLTWLIAFVIALVADGSDADSPIPQNVRYLVVLATPVVLFLRPRLGCAVAVASAVLLGVAGEPPAVVVPFAVHGLLCAYSLARFLIGPRRQRRLYARLAEPVAIELPGDPVVRTAPPARATGIAFLVLVALGLAVWAWVSAPGVWPWVGAVGFFAAIQVARHTAARLAARRLVSRPHPGAQVVVRVDPGPRLTLFTGDQHRLKLAWLPMNDVVHRAEDAGTPDVLAAVAVLDNAPDDEASTELFPATVVGDLRVGGYVAVLTDHAVLLPDGPVRALSDDPPLAVPTTLVDGRRWSGLQVPS